MKYKSLEEVKNLTPEEKKAWKAKRDKATAEKKRDSKEFSKYRGVYVFYDANGEKHFRAVIVSESGKQISLGSSRDEKEAA